MTTADQLDLDTVDITDASLFEDGPPHELFARMRREAPIRWNETEHFGGLWSLTRKADVEHVSKNPGTFSSAKGGVFMQPDQVMPIDLLRTVLLYKDPPEHTRYRKILQSAFTPNTVRALEDAVRTAVTRTIDKVIEDGTCDFAADIAVPIPLEVLLELMGLPLEDVEKLYEWTEDIEKAQRSLEPSAATDTFMAMSGYLHEQIEKQAAEGNSESLVMRLRNAEVDGDSLDDSEILTFFGLLVFAGNDTTRNTTAGGMLTLLEHPDALAALRDDPSKIPTAVEEILRWTSVVNYFVRTATEDTEVAGQAIAEGDRLLIWYTSASRDDEAFEDAQSFDIDRDPAHNAFGGGGRHFCLGAGLARLELKVIFEEVLRRMPDIALDGDVERLRSAWANSVTSLPVTFTPGTKEGE